MKVLFIGGTGTISSAVSALAVKKGFELYLLNRGNYSEFMPAGAKIIKGDIRNVEETRKILKDYKFDVVVDWIAFNPDHIKTDIRLFKNKVDQFVFISSTACYQRPVTHYYMDESTPLCNPYWDYAQDKISCEDLLMKEYRENGFPVTIVRPSYTYGVTSIPHTINSRKSRWTIIDRMRKGKKIIVPGDGTSLWTITHNTDFAKGFVGLLGNIQALGHAFHITSDEVLNWNQITYAIGKAAGAKPDIIHIPSDFISAFAPELKGGLLGDKSESVVFNNSKIKRFVPDYKANVPFATGIKWSLEYFESKPELCWVDEEFNSLMDKIIGAYETGLKIAND